MRTLHQPADVARNRRALSPQRPGTAGANLPGRYNICPTDTIDAVVEQDGKRDLVPMRWGLVPWWWKKKAKETPATFNARAETVASKPMFRDAFKRKRCLIPASGYYEWRATPTGKQPYYYRPRRLAADNRRALGRVEGHRDWSAAAVMHNDDQDANALAAKIHDRMPVLLQPKNFDGWLAGTAGTELLKPAPDDYLQTWPVSRRVNSLRAASDDPTLIERVDA